jgi:hypothetical protein
MISLRNGMTVAAAVCCWGARPGPPAHRADRSSSARWTPWCRAPGCMDKYEASVWRVPTNAT